MQESIYGEVIHADEMSNLKYELETARITLKEQENRLKEWTYELETKDNVRNTISIRPITSLAFLYVG